MSTLRVLIVDGDARLAGTLCATLARHRMSARAAGTIALAQMLLREDPWHLVVLDVRLPDGSGLDLARAIKRRWRVPVMIVTALDSPAERLRGFQAGADEYLPKPFRLREFLLRVRHVIATQAESGRRAASAPITASDREIDFGALSVTRDGRRVYLPARHAALLRLLMEAAPAVVDRHLVLDRLWGADRYPSTRVVDNCILRIRRALGDTSGTLIETVRGEGYRWRGPAVDFGV